MSGNGNMPLRVMLSTTLQTALAGMHGVGVLLRFVAPMRLPSAAIFSFPHRPVHGSSGFTCRHQLGIAFGCTRGMACLLLGRHVAHLRPAGKGALGKANDASGLKEESRYTISRVDPTRRSPRDVGRG
jgi:hypothetical protein